MTSAGQVASPGEDTFVVPSGWWRHVRPRRGGVPAGSELVATWADDVARLVAGRQSAIEIIRDVEEVAR